MLKRVINVRLYLFIYSIRYYNSCFKAEVLTYLLFYNIHITQLNFLTPQQDAR